MLKITSLFVLWVLILIQIAVTQSAIDLAKRVLKNNWMGHSTKPSPKLYPHQWSWDSCFISIGYAHYEQERAMEELRTVFAAQWKNGMVPHIVFNSAYWNSTYYFPGPDWWQSYKMPNAPINVNTSGLCNPPVHSTAVLRVYQNKGSKMFLQEMSI
jgi:hypothetical protein